MLEQTLQTDGLQWCKVKDRFGRNRCCNWRQKKTGDILYVRVFSGLCVYTVCPRGTRRLFNHAVSDQMMRERFYLITSFYKRKHEVIFSACYQTNTWASLNIFIQKFLIFHSVFCGASLDFICFIFSDNNGGPWIGWTGAPGPSVPEQP